MPPPRKVRCTGIFSGAREVTCWAFVTKIIFDGTRATGDEYRHRGGSPQTVQAGEVIGIRVLDHIIIGDGDHFSFRDNGMIAGPH